MAIGTTARFLLGAGLIVASTSAASAAIKGLDLSPGTGAAIGSPIVVDHTGGTIHSISTRYDTATHRLDWTVNFSDRVTKGFWLVLTSGTNPVGADARPGQVAMFYFDGTDALDATPSSNIRLTAYSHNGLNNSTSWRDGDANPVNDIPRGTSIGDEGDIIKGAFETDWIFSLTATNTVLPGGIAGRTLGFSVDATDILDHAPRFNPAPAGWSGTGFGDRIGLTLHPVRSFNAIYDTVDNPTDPTDLGRIRSLSLGMPGSLDGSNLLTYDVPAPGAAALAGLGTLLLRRRKR